MTRLDRKSFQLYNGLTWPAALSGALLDAVHEEGGVLLQRGRGLVGAAALPPPVLRMRVPPLLRPRLDRTHGLRLAGEDVVENVRAYLEPLSHSDFVTAGEERDRGCEWRCHPTVC